MKRGRRSWGVLLVGVAACGPSAGDLASVDYTPVARDDWPVATPAEVGLDSALLARLYWDASQAETTWAVLVVKDGRLVAEDYFRGKDVATATNLQSATKSVTSALVGIAVDQGCLPGVDTRLVDYFPELTDRIRDPRKLDMTVEHLLQMRAGFRWEEADGALFDTMYAGFRPAHLAQIGLVREPGAAMEYSNLSSHLLGIVLARACHADLLEFANEHLFEPLGITPGEWGWSWEDYRLGMSSLDLTARDMARFGQLYLDGGTWKGRRVLDPAWVRNSLAVHSEDAWHIGIGDHVRDLAYGYQWWTVRTGRRDYHMAWGHGGQQIALVPGERLLVVVKADPLEGQHGGGPWRKEKENLNLVGDFIASLPPSPPEPAAREITDSLPTVAAVLDRYVAAVGGRKALEALETVLWIGREVDDFPDRGPARETPLRAAARYPDRWYLARGAPTPEREWCDGAGTWRDRGAGAEAEGVARRSLQAFLLDPRGPLRVAEYHPGLKVVGREMRNGHEVWVLHGDLDPTWNALAFEVSSGLLVQVGWYWTLDDYREVGGVLLPTRITQSRKGGRTTWVWDEVFPGAPLDPGLFDSPGIRRGS